MFKNLTALVPVLAVLGTAQPRALGAEAAVSIRALEAWSNVFGGRETRFHFTVTASKPFDGVAGWTLSCDRRTIARGETAVAASPQKTGDIEVRLDLPEVKAGVAVPAVLAVALYVRQPRTAEASLEKPLWIFPENPFADRSRWLEELKIRLFDPPGNTRRVLEKMKVPFSQTANVDSLGALEQGMLIVGEGTSFDDYRGLPAMMAKAAARGVPVLCLAPSAGEMLIPGIEDTGLPQPSRLDFRRNDVICDLDKRLDAIAWPPDGEAVAGNFAVRSSRGRIAGQVVGADAGWPWLEARFAAKHGRLVVCGFGLVRKWDAGPAPRFLFVRLLEYLDQERGAVP